MSEVAVDEFTFGAGAKALTLSLNASLESGAVGASGKLDLIRVNNDAGQSWQGIEATELNFNLELAPLSLAVTNGTLQFNQAPTGEDKLDWSSSDLPLAGLPSTLSDTIDWANTDLSVSGDVVVDFDGLFNVGGNFTLEQFDVTNDTLVGAGATGLALQLTVNGDASGGVSGSGSLKLLSLTNAAEQRWIGVEGIDLGFGVDLDALNIEVSNGSLLLNQGPEDETKLDWSSADVTAGGAPFALSTLPEGDWTSISLYVTGDASVAFGDLLSVEGNFALEQFDVIGEVI